MKRACAKVLAWLMLPLCLLPSGFQAMLCLASIGIATPCAACREFVSETPAESCCGHCEAKSAADRIDTPAVAAADPACDCCMAWVLAPQSVLPTQPIADATPREGLTSSIEAPLAPPASISRRHFPPPPGRGPPNSPLPLRI